MVRAMALPWVTNTMIGRWRQSSHRGTALWWESLRRAAILAVAATFWFAIVPTPVGLTLRFSGYSLHINTFELKSVAINAGVLLGVLAAWGLGHWFGQDWLNRTAYKRLLCCFEKGERDPGVSCVLEAALEGYRVARDTHAPRLARKHLNVADRLLRDPAGFSFGRRSTGGNGGRAQAARNRQDSASL